MSERDGHWHAQIVLMMVQLLMNHGSSESDFIHKRNEIYHSIADGELISEI